MKTNMAEAGGSKENPFSFKKFVKSKEETKIPKTKKTQRKQNSQVSALNAHDKVNFKDEAPFPEVNKEGRNSRTFNIFTHKKVI